MARVKLRDPQPAPRPDGAAPAPVALTPLAISGLVVTRAALVETLAGLVPGLVDVVTTEDGEHFWLMLAEPGSGVAPVQE
jgi:hypothetical protein